MTPNIGAPAPDFSLKDQDQKEVKLSDFRCKKPVVLSSTSHWSRLHQRARLHGHDKNIRGSERASPRHQRRQRMVPTKLRG